MSSPSQTSHNNAHTRSPSFPSAQNISEDIFFQVKKQILDKLDLILQKLNLQVIQHMKKQTQKDRKDVKLSFKFIELSSFEKEIQALFSYLDRLYSSLNSSVSFSTNDMNKFIVNNNINSTGGYPQNIVNSYNLSSQKILFNATDKSGSLNLNTSSQQQLLLQQQQQLLEESNMLKAKLNQYSEENFKLKEQNELMRFIIKNPSHSISHSLNNENSFNQDSKKSLKQAPNTNNVPSRSQRRQSSDKSHENSQQQKSINQSRQSKAQKSLARGMEGISFETVKKILRFYNHSIKQFALQYRQNTKQIKKTLKELKFQIVQNRVQSIACLKKYTEKIESQNLSNRLMVLQLKESVQFEENKLKAKKNSAQIKEVSANDNNAGQEMDQICSEGCLNRKNMVLSFQEDILEKIQNILDVC